MNNSQLVDLVYHPESGDPLPITPKDVELALLVLHSYPVKTSDEALLVLCAANLLNAAVKQKDLPVKGGYAFKGKVSDYVEAWCERPIEGVTIQAYKDVCYVEIDTIQFSFHHLAAQSKISCRATAEPWRGIRLQPLAKRMWDMALAGVEVSDETARFRWSVLSQALPNRIMQALGHCDTAQALVAKLQVDSHALDDALASLQQAALIEIHADHRITLNRWTLALLQRELQALGAGEPPYATR